jgi:two-component system response regulator AtoC
MQVKLLRVLQENEIRPVGDSKPMKVNVRVIAATAKNLEEEVKRGLFREDLYYRLNVLAIALPPLRERPEDIPQLCRYFLERFNTKMGKAVQDIAPAAMGVLLDYNWPGNVRELENVIERAVLLAEGTLLSAEHFTLEVAGAGKAGQTGEGHGGLSLKEAQRAIEKRLITQALQETGGNRTQAARLLEISHPSLLSKIKTYGIGL